VSRTKNPRKISEVVCEMCRSMGLDDAYQQYKTLQIWNSVVGEGISGETVIERFYEGQLFIRVKNPAWRMELNFRKKEIIRKLNEALKERIVNEIIFR
jgi:hypothetical protein